MTLKILRNCEHCGQLNSIIHTTGDNIYFNCDNCNRTNIQLDIGISRSPIQLTTEQKRMTKLLKQIEGK